MYYNTNRHLSPTLVVTFFSFPFHIIFARTVFITQNPPSSSSCIEQSTAALVPECGPGWGAYVSNLLKGRLGKIYFKNYVA